VARLEDRRDDVAPASVPAKSTLSIGEWGAWEINVTGEAGNFITGLLPPSSVLDPAIQNLSASFVLSEGALHTIELTTYERNEKARELCIEYYGPTCMVCKLDYEKKYGPIARGLIHVHHVTPLSSIAEEYRINPIRDLAPVCASCHHGVHSCNHLTQSRKFKAQLLAD